MYTVTCYRLDGSQQSSTRGFPDLDSAYDFAYNMSKWPTTGRTIVQNQDGEILHDIRCVLDFT